MSCSPPDVPTPTPTAISSDVKLLDMDDQDELINIIDQFGRNKMDKMAFMTKVRPFIECMHVHQRHRTPYKCKEVARTLRGEVEPMLQENQKRFVLSIGDMDSKTLTESEQMYFNARKSRWTEQKFDFTNDIKNFPTLPADVRRIIEYVLAFFAGSDGIVNENLLTNFSSETQDPVDRAFYGTQIDIENIHSITYSKLLKSYVSNQTKLMKLFNAIYISPSIARKAEWALKWTRSDLASYPERLVAFALVEGVFFSGSFCIIFWVKKYFTGKLPGLVMSNDWIARDEGMHQRFAEVKYRSLTYKLPRARVVEIVKEAVECEIEFVRELLPKPMIGGMNHKSMSAYIRFVANSIVQNLFDDPTYMLYMDENPFTFINSLGGELLTNPHDKHDVNYVLDTVDCETTAIHPDWCGNTDSDNDSESE